MHTHRLNDLIDALRTLGNRALAGDGLVRALRENVPDVDALASVLLWRERTYTRTLLFRTPAFELVGLAWNAGSVTTIHDHAGSHGVLMVCAGQLVNEDFALAPGGARLVRSGTSRLGPGDVDERDVQHDIHRVRALVRSVSLHVYAAPIHAFRVFGERDGSVSEALARYDQVRAA